jgi:dihydroneopterin aldolase/2-amino-4-hydroxy-6-hydroxymethyldihydropteridine diphosphokinase
MDKIYIKDLEVYAHHGVFQEEKNLGQRFLISIELFLMVNSANWLRKSLKRKATI